MDPMPDEVKQDETRHLKDGDMSHMMEQELKVPSVFFRNCALAVLAALISGAIIDNLVRKVQGDCQQTKTDAALYLGLQLAINIVVLFLVSRYDFRFVPVLQLTLSGLSFSVLFFAVQDNLLQNSLRLTRF
jgi:hypothetical protein